MLSIDPSSPTAPYEQLRSQLVAQIISGELRPGDRLPAVRRLAGDLGLAPNTVARTYRELEHQGFVRTAGRNGTVVATPDSGEASDQARDLSDVFVRQMRGLGLGPQAIITQVRRSLAG
mgnify:CR=1 FL=1